MIQRKKTGCFDWGISRKVYQSPMFYHFSQTIREDDLIFDQNENGFTTLEKLAEVINQSFNESNLSGSNC